MTAPAEDSNRRYRAAGVVYGALGLAVVAITVATPAMARPERRADLAHLLVGLPVLVAFALAVAYGDRAVAATLGALRVAPQQAAGIGFHAREKLTMLLTVTALARAGVFAANALGRRPRLGLQTIGVGVEAAAPEPRLWIGAVLMAVIAFFLARASWAPFLARWAGRGPRDDR